MRLRDGEGQEDGEVERWEGGDRVETSRIGREAGVGGTGLEVEEMEYERAYVKRKRKAVK